MKVFVTGIAGFLGSRIASDLILKGHVVSGCDTLIGGYLDNIPDGAAFYQVDCQHLHIMNKLLVDTEVVIHCACTAYEGLSVFSPTIVTQNTFQISSAVFTAAAVNRVRRVINCSSMARYGEQDTVPFTEDMTPRPMDPYGICKFAAEQLLTVLADVHDMGFVTLVPHNIIGAHQKYDDPFRNVAAIMINRMLLGQQPIIYGDGMQVRCFSDVRDILPCFVQALSSEAVDGRTINIGPDEEFVTILELAETIADIIGFANLDPVFVEPRPQEVRLAVCSSDLARQILGYQTKYQLRASLRDLAEWIAARGPKKFRYHLDLEIVNQRTPRTWTERLF